MILFINKDARLGGFIEETEKDEFLKYYSSYCEVDVEKCTEIAQKAQDNLGNAFIFENIEKAVGIYKDNPFALFFKYDEIKKTLKEVILTEKDLKKTKIAPEERIKELKMWLVATDYIVIKKSEGSELSEKNLLILENREKWREEIRTLEKEIKPENSKETSTS